VLQVLIKMPSVLMADGPGQSRTDQAAGTAGNSRRREGAKDRAAGGRDCEAAGDGRHVDPSPDDSALRIADRLARHIADPGRLGIVLEIGGRLVGASELGGDSFLV